MDAWCSISVQSMWHNVASLCGCIGISEGETNVCQELRHRLKMSGGRTRSRKKPCMPLYSHYRGNLSKCLLHLPDHCSNAYSSMHRMSMDLLDQNA